MNVILDVIRNTQTYKRIDSILPPYTLVYQLYCRMESRIVKYSFCSAVESECALAKRTLPLPRNPPMIGDTGPRAQRTQGRGKLYQMQWGTTGNAVLP